MLHNLLSCTDNHDYIKYNLKSHIHTSLSTGGGVNINNTNHPKIWINWVCRGKKVQHLCVRAHCPPVESVAAGPRVQEAAASPSPPVVGLKADCLFAQLERPAESLERRPLPLCGDKIKRHRSKECSQYLKMVVIALWDGHLHIIIFPTQTKK